MAVSAKGEKPEKQGILLVTFGSSYPEAQAAFDNIEAETREAFPGIPIYWAYTAKMIRKKLAKRGKIIDSPAEALAKMGEDGFTQVAVQSLHVIPGSEYHDLMQTVDAFAGMPKGITKVMLGKPLLFSSDDNIELAKVLSNKYSAQLNKKEALVFMGHGTHHSSNIYYPGFQYYMQKQLSNSFVGTVEGYPALSDVIEELERKHIKDVLLAPLMTVCGDHAQNDMASDEPDSWQSILEEKGFKVTTVLKGIAEYDDVVNIWIKHLKETMHAMDN